MSPLNESENLDQSIVWDLNYLNYFALFDENNEREVIRENVMQINGQSGGVATLKKICAVLDERLLED